ncbi:hypothetical protein L1987_50205 [Smallanthus sonchifolius]|uniref:Uncharacterized protein n=1 Tax=Smallanthus sonchifolius TaxID=185202 RepID=A0ACB9FWU7_9ASTR|nr:hypothetical protein L1987_50205 [Smallanthus sonchifolius]
MELRGRMRFDSGFGEIVWRNVTVVADALSCKEEHTSIRVNACQLIVTPDFMTLLRDVQAEALREEKLKEERIFGQRELVTANSHGAWVKNDRIWIPKFGGFREQVLDEAHKSRYSIHPEHQKPYGKIQPLKIQRWKWEHITMDFITKLPKTAKGHDTIWVVVDRLTKSAHFLPIRETFSSERFSVVFVNEIVARHGVPISIVSDRDTRFTSKFWKRFNEAMGTKLHISTSYHPQIDGQSELTIQTLEDMLRACVIDFGGAWDSHLPLAEFSYNNSYHTTIGMPPYEMLYGRKCRTPMCWGEIGQKELGSLDVVKETSEKFRMVKLRMKAAQSRQKSYADKRRRPIEFKEGDYVMLKVSTWKGIIHELAGIHPTFHVSHLRKCLADATEHVPLDDIVVDDKLNCVEEPVAILDRKEKRMRRKVIPIVKVQWKHRHTWEPEAEMRERYPHLFPDDAGFRRDRVKKRDEFSVVRSSRITRNRRAAVTGCGGYGRSWRLSWMPNDEEVGPAWDGNA